MEMMLNQTFTSNYNMITRERKHLLKTYVMKIMKIKGTIQIRTRPSFH